MAAYKDKEGYIGMVKVGAKGQIVIPKDVRDMFGIDTGDSLVILADAKQGIALQKPNILTGMAESIFQGKGKELFPEHSEEDSQKFAKALCQVVKEDDDDGCN